MKTAVYNSHNLNNHQVFALSINNHIKYALQHNYDLICVTESYTTMLPVDVIVALLQVYDNILTCGSDIFFTDFDKSLDEFISGPIIATRLSSPSKCFNGDFTVITRQFLPLAEQFKQLQDQTHCYQRALNRFSAVKLTVMQRADPAMNTNTEGTWKEGDFAIHMHAYNI